MRFIRSSIIDMTVATEAILYRREGGSGGRGRGLLFLECM